MIPWIIQKSNRQRLYAALSESFIDGRHLLKVFVAERFNVEIAAHSPGVLPKVEKILPFSWRRQYAVDNSHRHRTKLNLTRFRILSNDYPTDFNCFVIHIIDTVITHTQMIRAWIVVILNRRYGFKINKNTIFKRSTVFEITTQLSCKFIMYLMIRHFALP